MAAAHRNPLRAPSCLRGYTGLRRDDKPERADAGVSRHFLRLPMYSRDAVRRPVSSLVEKLPSVQITMGSMIWISAPRGTPGRGSISSDLGITVIRRAAFQHIGDVDVVAGQTDPRQQLFQQLAGLTDKRYCPAGLRDSQEPHRQTSSGNQGFPNRKPDWSASNPSAH